MHLLVIMLSSVIKPTNKSITKSVPKSISKLLDVSKKLREINEGLSSKKGPVMELKVLTELVAMALRTADGVTLFGSTPAARSCPSAPPPDPQIEVYHRRPQSLLPRRRWRMQRRVRRPPHLLLDYRQLHPREASLEMRRRRDGHHRIRILSPWRGPRFLQVANGMVKHRKSK